MLVQSLTEGKEPSRIMLSFYDQLEGDELELKACMLYNAICLLSAASNLLTIEFVYNEQRIELERALLESWYGTELTAELTEYTIMKHIELKLAEGSELPL